MAANRNGIIEILKGIEHPEIAVNLVDLGMIMDVGLEDENVNIALGFPVSSVPQQVRDTLINKITPIMKNLGLETKFHYFEMHEEDKKIFFRLAKSNWKRSL